MNRRAHRFGLTFLQILIATLALQSVAFASPATEETEPEELSEISSESFDKLAAAVGIQANSATQTSRKLKIAILDNGFRSSDKERGTTLPESTKLRPGPDPMDPKKEEWHGTHIAQIFSNLLDRTGTNYELHLFPSYGYANLSAAVNTVIKEKFDLVLYSQVWEYSGNDDGKGFINSLVNSATEKGVIWVNASGNFALSTYRARVERTLDDWANLPGPNSSVQIRCYDNKRKTCRLRVVLSWNSFADQVEVGTDKDLDLVLTDDTGKIIETAGLIQKKTVAPGEQGVSLYPREIVKAEVKPGLYYARVKIRSAQWDKNDILRINLSGDFTEMLNRTEGETLFPPADNFSVITVGASDTGRSSFSRSNGRPDLSAISTIETKDGKFFRGSSNTASAWAARISAELGRGKNHDRQSLLIALGGGKIPKTASSTPVVQPVANRNTNVGQKLGTTGSGCYVFHALGLQAPHVQRMLREGGAVVDTTSGPKIFIDENPFDRASRLGLEVQLQNADRSAASILVADVNGLYATAVGQRAGLAADTVEIVRTPPGATYCRLR